MDKRFWAIIGVIVVIFGSLLFISNHKNNTGDNLSSTKPTEHVKGKLDSKVTLLEYGDFQCSVCEGYNPTIDQVVAKYQDKIRFQFRHLPLSQVHPNALAAARAAEAASNQGKFWEMHDALYASTNWNDWTVSSDPRPLFNAYAQSLGLNLDQFKKDFASGTVNNRIQADIAAFNKTGEQEGTPSFFVNGQFKSNSNFITDGVPSVEAFSKVLDAALKQAGQ